MKHNVSPYYEYRQEISSKTIVLIGVFLVIIAFILTAYNLLLINHQLIGNIGTLSNKMKVHVISDKFVIINIIALMLSTVSIIIGFVSILRSKNIGWLVIFVSIVCFILNSI